MIAACSARPKHVPYTQDSCRRCCAAEGLPGRARNRREQMHQVRARRAWVYSITSSAADKQDGATLRSSDVAVLRLRPSLMMPFARSRPGSL